MDDLWNEAIQELRKLGQKAGVDLPDPLKKVSGTPAQRDAQRLRATTEFLRKVNAAEAKETEAKAGAKSGSSK